MRTLKKFGVLAVVFALSAIGAANASAASFTYSATGTLSGEATSTHVWATNFGIVQCGSAAISGTITEPSPLSQQHLTVDYSDCTLGDTFTADVSPATYLLTANGELHINNTITFVVTFPLGNCHYTINPQTVKPLAFANNGGKLQVTAKEASKLTIVSTGGICGPSGVGTFSGTSEIERVGGGSFTYDA